MGRNMKFLIKMYLPSLMNTRWHWTKMAALKKRQRRRVREAMKGTTPPRPPMVVIITRLGPRRLDDDNLAASCKYIRDQIAEEVGLDDGSPLYTWVYLQRVSKTCAVEIEMMSRR